MSGSRREQGRGRLWGMAALAFGLGMVPRGWACATCFGDPEAPMTQGLNMGILTLLLVVVMVLGGAAAFFIHVAKRAGANPLPADLREESDR